MSNLTNVVIHDVAVEVTKESNYLNVIKKMKIELFSTPSVGIAAPQIGKSVRIIICKINGNKITMINPTFTPKGLDKKQSKEGCLSFPDVFVKKNRFYRGTVKYYDENFVEQSLIVSGLSSFIVQHEVDHLNGITIV